MVALLPAIGAAVAVVGGPFTAVTLGIGAIGVGMGAYYMASRSNVQDKIKDLEQKIHELHDKIEDTANCKSGYTLDLEVKNGYGHIKCTLSTNKNVNNDAEKLKSFFKEHNLNEELMLYYKGIQGVIEPQDIKKYAEVLYIFCSGKPDVCAAAGITVGSAMFVAYQGYHYYDDLSEYTKLGREHALTASLFNRLKKVNEQNAKKCDNPEIFVSREKIFSKCEKSDEQMQDPANVSKSVLEAAVTAHSIMATGATIGAVMSANPGIAAAMSFNPVYAATMIGLVELVTSSKDYEFNDYLVA